jgi:uncharacterized protein (DUF362 family)
VASLFADNPNEFCSSFQVGHTQFNDGVIAAFRAIIDGDTVIPIPCMMTHLLQLHTCSICF